MDVWPEYGRQCEMNLFYRSFEGGGGWVGESFFKIWSAEEVHDHVKNLTEQYPEKYKFFATDGGGNIFGFYQGKREIMYVSATNIGDEDDIKDLGSWKEFLKSIATSNYI